MASRLQVGMISSIRSVGQKVEGYELEAKTDHQRHVGNEPQIISPQWVAVCPLLSKSTIEYTSGIYSNL